MQEKIQNEGFNYNDHIYDIADDLDIGGDYHKIMKREKNTQKNKIDEEYNIK